MNLVREGWTGRIGAGLGVACAAGAGLVSAVGLLGAVSGWADAANHFAPVWLVAGWVGAALVAVCLRRGRLRTAALASAAVAVVASGAPMVAEMVRTGREAPPPGNLVILTFNRWWDSTDLPPQVAMIRASGADIVALQEVYGFEQTAQRDLRELYPYQVYCHPGCNTAILSKRPVLASGQEDLVHWPGSTSLVWVRTTAPDGRPVTLATVHPLWPIPPWIQRGQRGHIADLVAKLPVDETVLVGDFNLTPWSFAMRKMEPTLLPLTRRTHGLLTFPATWPVPFLALDQVFAAPAWKTVRIDRLPRAASDHYPVRVELKR
ncbi:MAG TPA: endonuclease/exonuclease/phosphatase family protein [Caulobacteraceae bacterium]|jgi:endonuclease/exonuclease/phosphatase (EEP) superfamily protein YafD|nr:endonuclease/exonuclease/phosphatase family protein [Caulobacteraceae bacterium]